MHRSTDRILTTHPGRLPNPENQGEIVRARKSGDRARFDELMQAGIVAMVQRQKQIGLDILSDGEFWKARDQQYFDTRASGIETRPVQPGEAPSVPAMQRERTMPEFRSFWEIYEYVGNTPMPGVPDVRGFGRQQERSAITSELKAKPPEAVKHETETVKAAIGEAGAQIDDFFYPVLSPGWIAHFVFNDFYNSEEDYIYAIASFLKNDYKAVVDAGFVLQIDDPSLCSRWGMIDPPISYQEYRHYPELRVEALNWALDGIPEDRVRYHTCWGSWHTPHTTDIPLEHVVDIMLKVKAGAFSIEAADVRHELDWKVWEQHKLPDGKIFIPGVIAHKTTTIEPPELVADRIVRYAKIMGRENVIAGLDCGVGGRCYPDIGWAKLKSLVEGAEMASKQLWGR
jgi:5-methyltetrahydropteroyltriglutamate--homocysteine methyltransferase